MIKERITNKKEKNMKQDFGKAIERLLEGIKDDYANWGFIANDDGVLKGVPYKKGDVFKAAGWRAPAKWQRGSIYDSGTNWFAWTGPRYL